MPVEAFTVSVVDVATEVLVTVTGELDALNCQLLTSSLAPVVANGVSDVVIDLGEVAFADSAAVHLLTTMSLELLAGGRRLIVTDPSAPVARLLSLTELAVWFSARE